MGTRDYPPSLLLEILIKNILIYKIILGTLAEPKKIKNNFKLSIDYAVLSRMEVSGYPEYP